MLIAVSLCVDAPPPPPAPLLLPVPVLEAVPQQLRLCCEAAGRG
jgi:hypothetical protein